MSILEFKMEEGVKDVAQNGRPLGVKEYPGSDSVPGRMQRDGGAGSVGSAANSDHKEVRNVTGTVAPGDTLEDAKVTARGTGIVELYTLCICLIADC